MVSLRLCASRSDGVCELDVEVGYGGGVQAEPCGGWEQGRGAEHIGAFWLCDRSAVS